VRKEPERVLYFFFAQRSEDSEIIASFSGFFQRYEMTKVLEDLGEKREGEGYFPQRRCGLTRAEGCVDAKGEVPFGKRG
jgi:hypothetical protein